MLLNRRHFVKQTLRAAGSIATSPLLSSFQKEENFKPSFVVLHTNDVHSHLEPFPMDGSEYQGLGGVAARAELIHKIKRENEHVLLLDAGDIFQGTPYFHRYKGEPDIKAMSLMNYDAVTMGNHDFDAGIENYANMMANHANFPLLICNYDFRNTPLEGKFLPYKVFTKGDIKIGVTGAGIALQGLVSDDLYGDTAYMNPVEEVNKTTDILRRKEKCDFIICLSHLGDKYHDNTVSDDILAKETYDVDLIIGGHTHRFFPEPKKYINKRGKEILVNQVGWAGIQLGRLDYNLQGSDKKILNSKTLLIGKKYED